jgi:Rad3-related DNA helicase
MSERILLLGDSLACLASLARSADVDVAGTREVPDGSYSAAVIGIRLADDHEPATAREAFHARIDECMDLAQKLTSLKHLILVIGAPDASTHMPREIEDRLLSSCDSLSETLQAEVEQRIGTYVIVTMILASSCKDPDLLAERVLDRATQSRASDAATVVLWEEIEGESIADVGVNQFI